VCGDRPHRCDPIELVQDDIEVLEFDVAALRHELVKLLGLRERAQGGTADRIAAVGAIGVRAGLAIPVFLGFPNAENPIAAADLPVLSTGEKSGIILAPSSRFVRVTPHWSVLPLPKLVGANHDQSLEMLEEGVALLEELKGVGAGQSPTAPKLIWSMPPDARWEEVTFHFMADEVLSVRFRKDTKRFEPDQFGMKSKKNGKPTLEWVLLRSIAQTEGTLPLPHNSKKRASVRKQKQALSKALRQLFGITQDPIRVAGKSYEARFGVLDSRTINAPARLPRL
jgi:hypothetical protein